MRSIEELPGTLVLVLNKDLPELHSKIGTIVSELLEANTLVVNLSEYGTLTFSVHDLFVLRDRDDIEKSANLDQTLLPYWIYLDVMEVAFFANPRNVAEHTVAIELSAKDPEVLEYTMTSLAEELGMNRSYQISR